jgi:hypothetical protein
MQNHHIQMNRFENKTENQKRNRVGAGALTLRLVCLSALAGLSVQVAFAQQDTSINRQVEVVKAYQPNINDAYRISTTPRIVDTVQYTPTFDYKIYSKPIAAEKTIQNLPYVKLGNPPQGKANKGYLKGGIGSAYTPYAELVFNTSVTKSADFGFQVYHHSSQANYLLPTDEKVKAPYSDNFGRLFIKNTFKKAVLDWDMHFQRNRFDYYGFALADTLLYQTALNLSETQNKRQVFTQVGTQALLTSQTAASQPNYQIGLAYDLLRTVTGQAAHNATLNGKYSQELGENRLNVEAAFNYFAQTNINNIYNQADSHNYLHALLAPTYSIENGIWKLSAGLNFAAILGNDTTAKVHVSPKVNFEFYPIKDVMTLFVGTDGVLQPNNYAQLMNENRFLNYQTDARATNNWLNLYGGIKGKIGSQIAYMFDAGYCLTTDQYFYMLNQSVYPNGTILQRNTFDLIYDDMSTLRLGGHVRYSGPSLSLGVGGGYFQYDTKDLAKAFGLPNFKLKAEAGYNFNVGGKVLTLQLSGEVLGARHALIQVNHFNTNATTPVGTIVSTNTQLYELKPLIVTQFMAQYNYTERLAFFLNVNNLLNNKNDVWHGYSQQGINVLLGARFTF